MQAVMRALELAPYAVCGQGFVLQTSLALIAGSFMIHHCANTITAAGVGNGSTLVICTGIITGKRLLHTIFCGNTDALCLATCMCTADAPRSQLRQNTSLHSNPTWVSRSCRHEATHPHQGCGQSSTEAALSLSGRGTPPPHTVTLSQFWLHRPLCLCQPYPPQQHFTSP